MIAQSETRYFSYKLLMGPWVRSLFLSVEYRPCYKPLSSEYFIVLTIASLSYMNRASSPTIA